MAERPWHLSHGKSFLVAVLSLFMAPPLVAEEREPASGPPALEAAIARSHKALDAILNGDPSLYLALFADSEDITLGNPFGPFGEGREAVAATLANAASKYERGKARVERVALYADDASATLVEIEHDRAQLTGRDEFSEFSVRVTSLYRRFGSDWRLVHRHADPITSMRIPEPDAPIDLARRYAAAWSSQEPEAVAAFYAKEGRLVVNGSEPAVGRAAIADVARGFMEAFPDMVVAFDRLGEREGRWMFHWTLTGTNTGPGGTGASVRISGVEAWVIGSDGLIADSRGSFDAADYARQIGARPSDEARAQYSLFPADRSLTHAEDGVALEDGRLLVGDWDYGLVMLSPDGTKRPFGDFAAAGFRTKPDPLWNSPNGISWEPDGRHVLVADITGGHIYRVDTHTEAVARIYDHPFGVNAAVRDPSGAIWFTQSTQNTAGEGAEARMFAAADKPLGDGSVWRIAAEQVGKPDPQAVKIVDELDFANGIVFDAPRGRLYVNEIVANRILSFAVDPQTGALSDRRILATLPTPDNIELDADGDLWVASPFANAVYKVDPDTGDRETIFAPTPEASARIVSETYRRLDQGGSVLELLGPDLWGPMPGLLTGIILAPDGAVYVSGLGNALVKLGEDGPRPAQPEIDADKRQIQRTIDTVYAAISGPAGAPRDWTAFRGAFSKDARLFATTPEGLRGGSVEDYIALSSDALVAYGFREQELVNRIEIYGGIAQAWSSYAGDYVREGEPGGVRGINSFQLHRQADGTWRVHSLLWQQETSEFPLPSSMVGPARQPAEASSASGAASDAEIEATLDRRTSVIIAGIRSGDVSGIMDLYGTGSLYSTDNATLLSQPEAIRDFWVNVASSAAHDATLEVVKIERLGRDAFVEIQKYEVFDEAGEPMFGGYASLLWRKAGARWIIAADVSN
jgi:sugar lactone lactonase YvrE/ketosteroid isomerase-like protein